MAAQDEYDVIVIGAGPAGEVAAQRVRRAGLTAVAVERRLVGGECSFYACSPTKAMLRPVHATRAARRVRGSEGATLVPQQVLARRDEFVDHGDDTHAAEWLAKEGIDLVRGSARLVGERQVAVGERVLRARHGVIVATGSAAAVADIPGLREARPWTNIEATSTADVPGRLTVLGGGVVGCELAQTFAALGSRVVLLHRGSRLLERVEAFAAEAVLDALRRDGVDVRLDTGVSAVHRAGPTVQVTLADGSVVTSDEVLCAVGRVAATQGLGLAAVGVTPDERGYLPVDETLAVQGSDGASPWLYAVGDVTGAALLTHMGKYQARACADLVVARATGGDERTPALRATSTQGAVTQVIFTDPEVAAVGPTAEQARAMGIDARAVDVTMTSAAGAGLQADGYAGSARLVVDEARRVVVGATFVGQDTAELLHAATIAVVGAVALERLWHAVPAFPTMSEVWLRLLEEYGC
ncbi:MAG: dihydrolipoyl dehydrogenase family protein [Dermatophilaceae bacterium]